AALAAPAASGFKRAERKRTLEFPRDHGAHVGYRTEWWYFTGHLDDASGGSFGFQLTLFRFELDARDDASVSAWRTPRVILGHFALSDLAERRFHAFERLSRALPGIAGVSAAPRGIFLDDWSIEHHDDGDWRLHAAQQGIELTLSLTPASALVAQGDGGLSQKSSLPGNASYYYSVPRLAARGQLELDGATHAVAGEAWLDREWSTSALDRGQQGWDWFALHLDDGASLMFYQLRRTGGGVDPHSAGSYVDADGHLVRLAHDDVVATPLRYWTSPRTGTRYPRAWRLSVPALELELELEARFASQEWRGQFRYWEGAISVSGTRAATAIAGRGYLEMTGY
ncbi:MAG: lipocalin-like domain-containing protein, partial [Gammaproteobacteria bacterium]